MATYLETQLESNWVQTNEKKKKKSFFSFVELAIFHLFFVCFENFFLKYIHFHIADLVLTTH